MIRKWIAMVVLSALGVGLLLLAGGLALQSALTARLAADQKGQYLAYELYQEPTLMPPTSTPLPTPTVPPTPTATPTPTPTPVPQPPTRLYVPAIGVNSAIHPIQVNVSGNPQAPVVTWPEIGPGVAHDYDSVNPGQPGNILLMGHNNTAGQVFRRLSELDAGDEVIVYTDDRTFTYLVTDKAYVRALGAGEHEYKLHGSYLGPKREETLTLVSCWPYSTYTHRLYVVAKPSPARNP
jgi:sortase A